MNEIDQTITLALNGSDLLYADRLAQIATNTVTWIPMVLVLLYVLIRHNDIVSFFTTLLAIGLCVLLADQMASTVCKPIFERFRPAQDPLIMYAVDVVDGYRGGLYGFFSSHAANTMAVATFLSLMFRHRGLTFWLYSWVLVNCWTRVYLGVHYVGDLTVGCIWGALVGWGVYTLWRRYCRGSRCSVSFTMGEEPTAQTKNGTVAQQFTLRTRSGFSIASVQLLIAAIALSYLLIVFRAL